MKKNLYLVLLLFYCGLISVAAQNAEELTLVQKKAAAKSVEAVLKQYLKTSNLQKSGTAGYSEEQITSFLSLLNPGAMVWDDLTPSNYPDKLLTNSEKPVESMVEDYKKYFTEKIYIKYQRANVDYSNLKSHTAKIVVQREVSGTYMSEYFLTNSGVVLELNLKLSDDFSSAKITEIRKILSQPIACETCPKPVAIKTPKEEKIEPPKIEKPKVEKKISTRPKPGVSLALNFSGLFNAPNINTDLKKLNYDNLDASSVTGNDNNKITGGLSYNLGLEVDLRFGKAKKVGIGAGVFLNQSGATIKYDEIHLKYKGVNNSPTGGIAPEFLRLYTVKNVTEKISMSNVASALLFKYDGGNDKVGLYVHFGPIYVVSASAKSSFTADTSLYEAIYQFNGTDYGYFQDDTDNTDDWILTNSANSSNPDYPNNFSDFNVASKYNIDGEESFKFKGSVGGLLRVGVSIPLSAKMNLLAGANLIYLKATDNNKYKKSLDESNKSYNSAIYTVKDISNFNWGIHLGIVAKLYKK